MVIYADVIFFVNFVSTLTLILAYGVMFSCKRHILRAVIAAAVSGIYAVAEIVFSLPYMLRMAVLTAVSIITFGRCSVIYNTARLVFLGLCTQIVFMLIMAAMGNDAYIANGSVTVFSGDISGFVIYFLAFPLMLFLRRIIKMRSQVRDCRFTINGNSLQLLLLYDSGNLLTHNGFSVAVVAWSSVSGFLGIDSYSDFIEKADDSMVFNTVGDGGTLPIIVPDRVIADGREININIAVADREFKGCDGIIGI